MKLSGTGNEDSFGGSEAKKGNLRGKGRVVQRQGEGRLKKGRKARQTRRKKKVSRGGGYQKKLILLGIPLETVKTISFTGRGKLETSR